MLSDYSGPDQTGIDKESKRDQLKNQKGCFVKIKVKKIVLFKKNISRKSLQKYPINT